MVNHVKSEHCTAIRTLASRRAVVPLASIFLLGLLFVKIAKFSPYTPIKSWILYNKESDVTRITTRCDHKWKVQELTSLWVSGIHISLVPSQPPSKSICSQNMMYWPSPSPGAPVHSWVCEVGPYWAEKGWQTLFQDRCGESNFRQKMYPKIIPQPVLYSDLTQKANNIYIVYVNSKNVF